jgi:hypothetical protein
MKRDPSDKAADSNGSDRAAQCNIPTDVQELLVRGNPMRDIAPNALSKAIEHVIEFYAIAYMKDAS